MPELGLPSLFRVYGKTDVSDNRRVLSVLDSRVIDFDGSISRPVLWTSPPYKGKSIKVQGMRHGVMGTHLLSLPVLCQCTQGSAQGPRPVYSSSADLAMAEETKLVRVMAGETAWPMAVLLYDTVLLGLRLRYIDIHYTILPHSYCPISIRTRALVSVFCHYSKRSTYTKSLTKSRVST
jgi:hypothetical protein